MITAYTYNQEIRYPALLKMSIAGLGLSTALDHIDTIGDGGSMVVDIYFVDALSGEDVTTLDNFMSSYSNPPVNPATITAITTELQNDTKLLLVLRTRTVNVLSTMSYGEINGMCTLLGISP